MDTECVVYADGTVSWVPKAKYSVICPVEGLNVTCTFKFGSWTYDGTKINLLKNEDTIDLDTFRPHRGYEILDVPVVRNVKFYRCCKEPYIDVTSTLFMRRIPPPEWF